MAVVNSVAFLVLHYIHNCNGTVCVRRINAYDLFFVVVVAAVFHVCSFACRFVLRFFFFVGFVSNVFSIVLSVFRT